MKNNNSTWIIAVIAIIIIIGGLSILTFNTLVMKNENVNTQWAQVETQYQRRIDLIPNLVNTAKGYMQFESGLLEEITALRSGWMDAANTDEKIVAQDKLDSAISRLLLVYENYPELKSIEAIQSLMDELSGTENRISVERQRYNLAVKEYNIAIKTFPNMILAGIMGYKEKNYYESIDGANKAPNVDIST